MATRRVSPMPGWNGRRTDCKWAALMGRDTLPRLRLALPPRASSEVERLRRLATPPAPARLSRAALIIPASRATRTFLALTETWISPDNSSVYSFSHTPRPSDRGGGTGPLGCFLDELDTLLSSFPEDGTPLILLGDFNIHLEAPQSAAFLPLPPPPPMDVHLKLNLGKTELLFLPAKGSPMIDVCD
ncbi:hypothetical protein AAFF_G00095420 [Aldrovandia affinis]|uniref:Endonuclease/exonuclease/phosphatase domain-containing protein n=1 Tax=Aldrovandia affinis TaxID=143900 RepID=A0AAD7WC96_9TELE|nr:hypothetical protein AAFF_G00095420 [Aldrovandia affinis]